MRLELGDFLEALIAVSQLGKAAGCSQRRGARTRSTRALDAPILFPLRGLLGRADLEGAFAGFDMRSNNTPAADQLALRTHRARAVGRAERAAPPARPSAGRSPSSRAARRTAPRLEQTRGYADRRPHPRAAASCRKVSSVSRPRRRAGTNKEVRLFLAGSAVAGAARVYREARRPLALGAGLRRWRKAARAPPARR